MRLSLTLIAAFFFFFFFFFCFFNSFASGYGLAWYNLNELPGACTPEDVAKIDNDLENMLFERMGYPAYNWLLCSLIRVSTCVDVNCALNNALTGAGLIRTCATVCARDAADAPCSQEAGNSRT
jgi:hypothetical protein